MKNNYIIPYGRRFTKVGNGYPRQISYMCVDNLGIEVDHEKGNLPTDAEVRRHLIGWNEQNEIVIQANSVQEALQEFYDFPASKTGTKHKAIELVDSEQNPVIEYCGCKHMRLTKMGIACACYDEPTENGCMICLLDGLSSECIPQDCPIDKQREYKGWREETVMIGGVWVRRYLQTVKEMEPINNDIIPRRV